MELARCRRPAVGLAAGYWLSRDVCIRARESSHGRRGLLGGSRYSCYCGQETGRSRGCVWSIGLMIRCSPAALPGLDGETRNSLSSIQQTTTHGFDVGITADRLRVWGLRSGLSVMDQGLSSGASFLVNLCLARWLDSEAYGAFAVAFATLVFLSGFHAALLLEPMSAVGPAKYSCQIVEYCLTQLRLHCVLSLMLSVVLLATATTMKLAGIDCKLVAALAGSAIALPFLLLFWLARRMC